MSEPEPLHPLDSAPRQIILLYAVAAVLIAVASAVVLPMAGNKVWFFGAILGWTAILLGIVGYSLLSALVRRSRRKQQLDIPEDGKVLEPLPTAMSVILAMFPLLLLGMIFMAFLA